MVRCHPELAKRSEGPRSCNPRFLPTNETSVAVERFLSVLRRFGMTDAGVSLKCATRSAEVSFCPARCHPELAKHSEGARSCNPRFLTNNETLMAWARSLCALRRIGMTTRVGAAIRSLVHGALSEDGRAAPYFVERSSKIARISSFVPAAARLSRTERSFKNLAIEARVRRWVWN